MELNPNKPLDKRRFPLEVESTLGFPLAVTLLAERGVCFYLKAVYQGGEELTAEDAEAVRALVEAHEA